MIEGRPLTGEQITALVTEVADELPHDGRRRTIVVVGGSLLSWHGFRATTLDVDTIRRLDDNLRRAVAVVATRNDPPLDWLNDRATPWTPATFDESSCDVLLDHPRLTVLGAPLRDIFVMKLERGGAQDFLDLVRIWPAVASSFATAADVVAARRLAYPAAIEDPRLDEFVIEIARTAGMTLPRS